MGDYHYLSAGPRERRSPGWVYRDSNEDDYVGAGGAKRDIWHVGRDVYEKWTGAPMWVQDPARTVFPASGFRDLDWISKDNYVGSVSYSGRNCLVFVQGAPPTLNLQNSGPGLEQLDAFHTIAFIDSESRLPVEVRLFGDYRSFRFATPATDKLALPPDLVAQLKHDADIISRLSGVRTPSPGNP